MPYGGDASQWADVLYALDGTGRLIDADEGHLSSGSISSRQRRELWKDGTTLGLSQTGNWARRKLDLNGDGDYTDADELDDSGTFNVANEWLTRDTDSNSSVNYTLTHDAAGNLTNDGKGSNGYKYVYDAFGRLKEARNASSNALVAEYRYNGLGFRTGWHYDADADADVDSSDPWYYWCSDERWRMVATYRNSDSSPKERFVYHAAGFAGSGSSSYIDAVVLRDADRNSGWTSAADGTLEDRLYYAQNWRADVVAVLGPDDAATNEGLAIREWAKYDSYGRPRLRPASDYNHDGAIDENEESAYADGPFQNGDPEADLSFDGSVDINDLLLFVAADSKYYTPTANRKLYAGYEFDPYIGGAGAYHVRNRVLLAELGQWTRRDPLGYVDGMGLYEYVHSSPVGVVDSSGFMGDACGGMCGNRSAIAPTSPSDYQNCAPGTYYDPQRNQCVKYDGPSDLHIPTIVDPVTPSPDVSPAFYAECKDACSQGGAKARAWCVNGMPLVCICKREPVDGSPSQDFTDRYAACVREYEESQWDLGINVPCAPGYTGDPGQQPGGSLPGDLKSRYCRKASTAGNLAACIDRIPCPLGSDGLQCRTTRCVEREIAMCQSEAWALACTSDPNESINTLFARMNDRSTVCYKRSAGIHKRCNAEAQGGGR